MKKYFIFSNNLAGIGGAQLYILRKVKWLEARGFKVVVFTGNKDPILFEEFNNFDLIEIRELNFPPNILSKNNVGSIINEIINKSNLNYMCEEVYVESHQTGPALWAELYANKINKKNIVYSLAPFSLKREIYHNFFVEKINRNEFLGCNKSFLKSNFKNENFNNNYINIPFDKSEIQILECKEESRNVFDLNILTISRVEKTYIKNSIMDLFRYVEENNEYKINYDIYLDKTYGEKYEELVDIVNGHAIENLKVNLKGPINPLNNCVFQNQDLFIGMGTSILNASSMKLPSLVVDYRNNKYYGYFGEEHFEFGPSEYLAKNELSYYVTELIKNKIQINYFGEKAYNLFMNEFENESVNNKFIMFLEDSSNIHLKNIEIHNKIYDIRDLLDFMLVRFLGINRALKARKAIIRLITKNKNHK